MIYAARLFGELTLTAPDGTPVRFRDRKTACLFAYLLCHPDRPHARDALAARFWPDSDERAGRNSLNTALSFLRKAVGDADPAVLRSDPRAVHVDTAAIRIDTRRFERLAHGDARGDGALARWREALDLVRGEFLAGHYDDWVLEERQRLDARHRTVLARVAAALEADDDLDAALPVARRWTDAAPDDPHAHACLVRLLDAAGQSDEARQRWRHACRLWERDGHPTPDPLRRLADTLDLTQAPRLPTLHLPLPTDRFVGRRQEMERLSRDLLPGTAPRLTTLTGPGGVGKTRLALEAARRLAPAWRHRILHLPLLGLDTPERLPEALREHLGLRVAAGDDDLGPVRTALTDTACLLLLDDAGRLDPAGLAATLHDLLDRLPGIRVLATSRRPIGVAGEREIVVPPLDARPGSDARALFLDRLANALPGYEPDPDETARIDALCRSLDGVPLALEIAAARYAADGPSHQSVPTADRIDVPELVAQSIALLSPGLRQLLLRLSVFGGGWSAAAAEAVGADLIGSLRAHDLLTLLRQSSLIAQTRFDDGFRYAMLETVRTAAAAQLAPDERTAVRQSHARWFADLAETIAPHLHGDDPAPWVRRLQAEEHNVAIALAWTRESGDTPLQLRLCRALAPFWASFARHSFARQRFAEVCEAAHTPSDAHADAWFWLGLFCAHTHDVPAADAAYATSLSQYRALGDRKGIAHLLRRQAELHAFEPEDACRHLEASLALYDEIGDAAGASSALLSLGGIFLETCRHAEAEARYRDALARLADPPPPRGRALILSLLGDCLRELGRFDEADAAYRECEALFTRIDDVWGRASARNDRARLALARDDLADAERFAREACALVEGTDHLRALPFFLQTRGVVAHSRGDRDAARRQLDDARAVHRSFGATGPEGIVATYQGLLRLDEGDPEGARDAFRFALPALRAIGERKRLLLCLTGLVRLWTREARDAEAAALHAALDPLLPDAPALFFPVHRIPFDRVAHAVRGARPAPPPPSLPDAATPLERALRFAAQREGWESASR